MNCQVTLRPDSEGDLADAFDWYEERSEGLGSEFLSSVGACITSIGRVPVGYGRVHGEVRRALVRLQEADYKKAAG